MATTVATLRATVILKLGIGTTANEPTTAMVDLAIREGFREGFSIFQPPFKSSVTISSDAATQAADRILYVLADGLILIEGEEWQHGSGGVIQLPRRFNAESATIYYASVPDLTTSTIESSCVLGDDWLEPFVQSHTVSECFLRLSQSSTSHGGTYAAAHIRTNEERRTRLAERMQRQRDTWQQTMENLMARRLALGPRVRRESAWAGFSSKGRMSNSLTGVES